MARSRHPLFWCLKVDRLAAIQPALMQYQLDNYGELLNIPNPPMVSDGVWLNTQLEASGEIAKLMEKAPSRSRE